MARLTTAAACLLAAAALAGCGNERSEISLSPMLSGETREVEFPNVGLMVELPDEVQAAPAEPPQVFRSALGRSVVAAYAYERDEQLPRDQAELDAALERLEDAATRRAASWELEESRTLEVGGARAVELIGEQTISGGRLRTQSLHVYDEGAEYVFELLAPPRQFEGIASVLFPAIERSLEVTGEIRAPEAAGE
jgi:hypothetical protein